MHIQSELNILGTKIEDNLLGCNEKKKDALL